MQTAEETHEARDVQQDAEAEEAVGAAGSLTSFTIRDVASMAESPASTEWGLDLDAPLPLLVASATTTIPGALYFTLRSNNDTLKAIEKGAVAAVSTEQVLDANGAPFPTILCQDPEDLFRRLAVITREQSEAKVVAITGSVGKTSTKDMLQLVMESSFKTVTSRRNQNGIAQVARYIQRLSQDTQIYIQETGISVPGSIECAASMLQPSFFVLTNIGYNHIGYFDGKQENILHEKLALDRHAAQGAKGFVNIDDPLLRNAEYIHEVVSYSLKDSQAEYYACNIEERNASLSFEIVQSSSGAATPVKLRVPGLHNVLNAVCAFAVGSELGVDAERIAKALGEYRSSGVRQRLVELNGQQFYLDCYNASEEAFYSVARTASSIDIPSDGKRVLVAADIDDKLGELTEEIHRRVGVNLAKSDFDVFLCYGAHAAWIGEEVKRANGSKKVVCTQDRAELERHVAKHMRSKHDLLCFKGGQHMELSRTLDNLLGTPFFLLDGDVYNLYSHPAREGDLEVKVIEGYGAVISKYNREDGKPAAVTIPSQVGGEAVRVIGRQAFYRTLVTRVAVPAGVQSIDQAAFFRCSRLHEVKLPSTLRVIGPSAFNTCRKLEAIRVPKGVHTIERRAFAFCKALKDVYLPSTIATIDPEAFNGSDSVTIHVPNKKTRKLVEQALPGIPVLVEGWLSETFLASR
ncbi:MAG: Mur ligase family protein [Coriobacteriales bacterium]